MTLTPATLERPPSLFITPQSYEGAIYSITTSTATAYLVANQAIYCPVYLSAPITILRMFIANGATVSGNVDVGVYLPDANNLPGTRLISKGTTAMSGVSVCQYFDVTDTACPAGLIYLAMACDNTTATFLRHAPGLIPVGQDMGLMTQTSAFVLPASATPATYASAYLPLFGIVRTTSP